LKCDSISSNSSTASTADELTFASLYNGFYKDAAKVAPTSSTLLEQSVSEGRPIWQARKYATKKLASATYQVVNEVKFAAAKLLCAWLSPELRSLSENQALAVASVRYSVFFHGLTKTAKELVASHFATCFDVDESRQNMLCGYPSEPMVSEAAAQIMNDDQRLCSVLTHLRSAMCNGVVEAGVRGELVSKIIMIAAWDHAIKTKAKALDETTEIFFTQA